MSSIIGFSACGKKAEKTADQASSGDGCEGISATDAKMRCDGNSLMFCSSYSNYKWKETQKCAEGKKCVIAEDGKSGQCK